MSAYNYLKRRSVDDVLTLGPISKDDIKNLEDDFAPGGAWCTFEGEQVHWIHLTLVNITNFSAHFKVMVFRTEAIHFFHDLCFILNFMLDYYFCGVSKIKFCGFSFGNCIIPNHNQIVSESLLSAFGCILFLEWGSADQGFRHAVGPLSILKAAKLNLFFEATMFLFDFSFKEHFFYLKQAIDFTTQK